MDYYYKSKKYVYKNSLYGGIILTKKIPNQGIDIETYFILQGGDPIKILSLINTEYLKIKNNKYILGLRSISQPSNLNYRFITHENTKYPPALTEGGFSVIYELKNESNTQDETKYILRLFDRKATYSTESNIYHMCDKKKIKEEYTLFSKYLIHIYHYGVLKIYEKGNARQTNVDYIITKMYNTSKTVKINEFSKENKIKFLRNNIEMLAELEKNNCFLGDYKLSNIGWDDELNIFLIDYDSDTIIRIDDKIFSLNSKIPGVRNLSFIVTYIPNYLTVNKKYRSSDVNNLDISKYNKYSVGGLIKIIEGLELNNLIDDFKLNDPDYENILSYDDMLKNLSI